MSKRSKIIAGNEVSDLVEWNLGGYPQKVLIEGKRRDLPVVITLHGGPGTPIPFSVGCRGLFPQMTDRFLMVYWDQLGCGINNHSMEGIFSVERMVEMTLDLVKKVRETFPQNKILLQSVSWGTVLSAMAADALKDEINGVVACGQVVRNLIFNPVTMEALKNSRIPQKKLQKIQAMEPQSVTAKDAAMLMNCIRKYTQGQMNPKDKPQSGPVIFGLMTSPDYSFRDFRAVVNNGYTGLDEPFQCLMDLDLREQLRSVPVPYRILQGDTDLITPADLAEEAVKEAENPLLTCCRIPDTSHFFGIRGMETMVKALTELAED